MQFDPLPEAAAGLPLSAPFFQKQAVQLVKALQAYDDKKLMKLMGISAALAKLNVARFDAFAAKPGSKAVQAPAIFAYRGDTYQGLSADTFNATQLKRAQLHIGMISGLYGLLQPLDLIQPYRLEMAIRLPVGEHKDLYSFWAEQLMGRINALAKETKARAVIGLVSQEYLKVVALKNLAVPFINCDFKEEKNGMFQTVGLFAKQARGMMARFVVTENISDPKDLKDFSDSQYRFSKTLSDDSHFVFTRKGK